MSPGHPTVASSGVAQRKATEEPQRHADLGLSSPFHRRSPEHLPRSVSEGRKCLHKILIGLHRPWVVRTKGWGSLCMLIRRVWHFLNPLLSWHPGHLCISTCLRNSFNDEAGNRTGWGGPWCRAAWLWMIAGPFL